MGVAKYTQCLPTKIHTKSSPAPVPPVWNDYCKGKSKYKFTQTCLNMLIQLSQTINEIWPRLIPACAWTLTPQLLHHIIKIFMCLCDNDIHSYLFTTAFLSFSLFIGCILSLIFYRIELFGSLLVVLALWNIKQVILSSNPSDSLPFLILYR